jgi:molybdopterin-guanine dinucleotide biosynthesis protein A
MLSAGSVTGLVLAGGRGSRMGGVDKGLQNFNGTALALNALLRLQLQQGGWIGDAMINANRNLAAYEAFGVPVWPDSLDGYAGPLAGFLTGLERCETPYMLTVPCDSPWFPLDLADRLVRALQTDEADIAMVSAPESDGQLRPQPVFTLMSIDRLESLSAFIQSGGRKIDAWTDQQRTILVPFNTPADDPRAFFNVNTREDLRALET